MEDQLTPEESKRFAELVVSLVRWCIHAILTRPSCICWLREYIACFSWLWTSHWRVVETIAVRVGINAGTYSLHFSPCWIDERRHPTWIQGIPGEPASGHKAQTPNYVWSWDCNWGPWGAHQGARRISNEAETCHGCWERLQGVLASDSVR